jgi:GNAT superfamily N-acetyltransferase
MVNIRQATDSDTEGLIEIARLSPISSRIIQEGACDADFRGEINSQRLHDPNWCVLVALDEVSAVVGYAVGCDWGRYFRTTLYRDSGIAERRPAKTRAATLEEIIVLPEYQHRGIGSLLVRGFEEWARDHGCNVCEIAGGPAPGFYEKLGYQREEPFFCFSKVL